MVSWGEWLLTAAGVLLGLAVVRDIFHTLWHPSGRGDISHLVLRSVWRLGRRHRRRGAQVALAGPVGLLLVVATWLAMVIVGGALVYAPHLPESFVLVQTLPDDRGDAIDAVYLSIVTLTTLGFGDIVPDAGWLRVVVPLQALLGFGLLTAAVSWVTQVHPALTRRRVLAVRLALLRFSDTRALLSDPRSALAATLLEDLAAELAQARVDLSQYPETYYFRDGHAEAALPAMMGVAARLAVEGRDAPRTDVRLAAGLLESAVDDFARVLDDLFLGTRGSTAEVLDAYAADHAYRLGGPDLG